MSEKRMIYADDIVKVADHAYDQWNLAMAAADGQREINLCFKRQDLCKAVAAVAKNAPTIDPETLPIVQELREKLESKEKTIEYLEDYRIKLIREKLEFFERVPNEGDSIYYIEQIGRSQKVIRKAVVSGLVRNKNGWFIVAWYMKCRKAIRLFNIGKTAFLTREEAEAALNRRKTDG